MALTCEGVIKSSKSVNWRAPLKPAAILFLFVLPLVNRGLLHWPSLQSSVAILRRKKDCQISYVGGLGTSPCIMGLTTQDPYI